MDHLQLPEGLTLVDEPKAPPVGAQPSALKTSDPQLPKGLTLVGEQAPVAETHPNMPTGLTPHEPKPSFWQRAVSDEGAGKLIGHIGKAWEKINTPIADLMGGAGVTQSFMTRAITGYTPEQIEDALDHPEQYNLSRSQAFWLGFFGGKQSSIAETGASFTSPVAVGMEAAGGMVGELNTQSMRAEKAAQESLDALNEAKRIGNPEMIEFAEKDVKATRAAVQQVEKWKRSAAAITAGTGAMFTGQALNQVNEGAQQLQQAQTPQERMAAWSNILQGSAFSVMGGAGIATGAEEHKAGESPVHDYYRKTVEGQPWEENAAKRAVQNLDKKFKEKEPEAYEEARQKTVQTALRQNLRALTEKEKARAAEKEAYRQERIEARPEKRQASAGERTRRGKQATEIQETRAELNRRRHEAQEQGPEVAQRHVEAVPDGNGGYVFPATYWGEENTFGVAHDVEGHGVYRQTPRGIEWLDSNGSFSETPEQGFVTKDPDTAVTLARISSLKATAESLAEGEGGTPEQKRDADALADIHRQLVTGEIDAKTAQKQVGIAEKIQLPDEIAAARDGRLNGPFHESSVSKYLAQLEEESKDLPEEDRRELLDNAGLIARQQTEQNLHHVYQPGDYITSKSGVRWTLDSKGMLHPDDGGQPVPLMKRGFYSNQAMQLAESGQVGYGSRSRAERRADAVRRREIAEAIADKQEEVDREMRLAAQQQGLQTVEETAPRADTAEKQAREARLMSRPPRKPESQVGKIVRMVMQAIPEKKGIISSIAEQKGVSQEEVKRIALATYPALSGTTEQKIAGLEVGDRLGEPVRKSPWIVEQGKDGSLYLRSGNAQPLKLDRLNPSEFVKNLMERAKLEKDLSAESDQIASDKPAYTRYEQEQVQAVEESAKEKPPEPKTETQAKVRAKVAERRARVVESVATKAAAEALDPQTTNEEEAVGKAEEAEKNIKTAEEAYKQEAEAKSKTEPEGEGFQQKAPVTIGLRGNQGTIVQNQKNVPFHFELVPIEALMTSHEWHGSTLIPNPTYPEALQPRTISEGESKQNALRAEIPTPEGGGYDWRQYADKTINGAMGPAIVDNGGQVVGGNTRIAILRKHLQNLDAVSDPEQRDIHKAGMKMAMERLAKESGITRYPDDGKFYVVVRMLEEPIKDTRQAAELGRLFNKHIGVEITKSARGVSFAKSFDEPLLAELGRRVEVKDGILPAMKDDPEFFRDLVINRFGITPEEYANWFEEMPGRGLVLHEEGRNQFVKALLGTVIKDTSILNRLEGKTPYRALERALGYIVKMRALPDRDISSKIVEAMTAAAETQATDPGLSRTNDKWSATYNPDQQELMGMESDNPPEPDRVVEAIWRALHTSDAATPRVFNDRLKSFIGEETSKGGWLIESQVETPAEAFNRAFKTELRQVQHMRGDSTEGVTQEEFDAALKGRELSDQEREEAEDRADGREPIIPAAAVEPTEAVPAEASQTVEKQAEPAKITEAEKEYVNEALEGVDKHPAAFRDEAIRLGVPKDTVERLTAFTEDRRIRKSNGQELRKLMEPLVAKEYTAEKSPKFGLEPPRTDTAKAADERLASQKQEQGYVTASQLREFLKSHPGTKAEADDLMRTATLMAEYVYDADPPVGVEKSDALDWVLRERLAKIERGESKGKRGEYSDPEIEKNFGTKILKLHDAADPTTFIHEFAHVIFPLLSDEDLKAIDTIGGHRMWEGRPTGNRYAEISEKLAHGLEQFLRDENPTGFTAEVKQVLAKVKAIMRKVYLSFAGDPLSKFKNTEESRAVFAKMFGITGFDKADDFLKDVRKAKAEEKRIKKPSEEPHPLVALGKEMGASGLAESLAGKIEDSVGERVDPRKGTAVLKFNEPIDAVAAFQKVGTKGNKIQDAELIRGEDGTWGIRFNTDKKLPPDILHQDLPERNKGELGLALEDMEKQLRETPSYKMTQRQLLELKIRNLKNRIRAEYGAEELKPETNPELADKALEEAKSGRETANGVRKESHGVSGIQKPQGVGRISKPSFLGMPGHAGSAERGGAKGSAVARVPASLAEVKPVGLEPIAKPRGNPVGTVTGEAFDPKAWVESLKRSGLPENAPAPTYALDPKTAAVLKFPGQKQVVQLAMSALEQGDGVVIATATGTGKTFSAMGTVKEFLRQNPDALVLHITKNRGLVKSAVEVGENYFGLTVEGKAPKGGEQSGIFATSYVGLLNDQTYQNMKWDLVVADESGEARNWYAPENQQGKMLKKVIEQSRKAIYLSATPFHSPMEYGYLDKLGLWPKGGFDKWIEQNFAHEKIGDRVVARLDPAKQAKLRQQLIERGQLVSQAISYDGYTAHFGVVPVTDQMKRGLDRIHEGFARAKSQFIRMGKKGMSEKAAAFEATYTKAFLERERIPQAIELAKQARDKGWQVMLFSETSSEDLFRRERTPGVEPSTYQELDDAMGGQLSKIIPPFENVYDRLKEKFGDQIGDYSGRGNTAVSREEAKQGFMTGKQPMLYSTYAAGGIGVSLHDADFPEMNVKGGDKPRVAIFLGPPYSGVLLEQAMGRSWRFGVKSDVHAVFLATDSEPDVRLMSQKVGPRMRALRAAVHGEKDSLASAMGSYTDEEKVRARQDALAYAEGDEVRVNAGSYQVRSKSRDVGINNWSEINFPNADTAKNKGMKYGEQVTGGDWSTLYQSKFGGMEPPPSPQDEAGKKIINEIGNAAVSGKVESVQNLDSADREAVTGAAASVSADAVDANVKRDKSAAARQAMEKYLHMPIDPHAWRKTYQGKKVIWEYTGSPEDLQGVFKDKPTRWQRLKEKINLSQWYGGSYWSQEIGIRSITRRAGMREVGEEINRINRSFERDREMISSGYIRLLVDIMHTNKVNPHDPKVMDEIWSVVRGETVSENPAINRVAADIADLNAIVHDDAAKAEVKLKTPSGAVMPWSDISKDPHYMPNRVDWDAKLQDPVTKETATLKEVMGKTFAEDKRRRIIESVIRGRKSYVTGEQISYDEAVDYLKQFSTGLPVVGEFNRARTIDFPIIKKDYNTLIRYYLHAGDAISLEKNFGQDRHKLNAEIDKLPNEASRKTIKTIFDGILEPQKWDDATAHIYNLAVAYEVGSKMTLSVGKVLYHGVTVPIGLKGRVRPSIEALAHIAAHPIESFENATYVGTLARQVNAADIISEESDQGITHWLLGTTGFNAGYKLVRVFAGESARIWMEQYAMHELQKPSSAPEARRLLKDVMLIGDHAINEAVENGRFSPEDLAKGQTAFANLTTWSNNPAQMPGWARLHMDRNESTATISLKRAVRLTYGLQSFSLRMSSFLRENLWDEAMIHHNLKPLAYFAVMSYPVGKALQATGLGLSHGLHAGMEKATHRGHKKDRWDAWWEQQKDLFENPTEWKAAKDFFDTSCLAYGLEMAKVVADPFMDLAQGNRKKSAAEFRYLPRDVAEHVVGPAYMDLFKTVFEFPSEIGKIKSAQHHREQIPEKEHRALWKYATDQVPALKLYPPIEEKTEKKKTTGFIYAPPGK